MADSWKATIAGGRALGRASNLPNTMILVRAELKHSGLVFLRRTDNPGIVATFRGFPPEVSTTNSLGERIENPDWVTKALNLLNH